jgi:polysaccharide biosynthesis transport protein
MELRRYWEILRKRKWIFLSVMIATPLLALVGMLTMTPVYQCRAKLWVNPTAIQAKLVSGLPTEFGKFEYTNRDNFPTTVEVLMKSDSSVGAVINELGLKDKRGNNLKIEDFLNLSTLKLIFQKKGLYIGNIVNSDTFEITGYSNDPSEAKKVAEKTIEKFINSYADIYKKEAEKALQLVENRTSEVRRQLFEAENLLEEFKTKNNLFNIANQGTTLIAQIATLENETLAAEKGIVVNKKSLAAIKEEMGKYPEYWETQTKIEASPQLAEARRQLLTLEMSLAKSKTELTEEHPEVKTLMNQINIMKKVISQELAKTFSSQLTERNPYYTTLISNYSSAEIDIIKDTAKARVLSGQIASLKKSLKDLPAGEKELTRLSTNADTLKTVYTGLLSNLESIRSARDMNLENAIVAQPPFISKNVKDNLFFPKQKKTGPLALAVLLGGVFGLAFMLFTEYLDESVWTAEDIRKISNHPIIGVIPKLSREHLQTGARQSPFLEDKMHDIYAKAKMNKGSQPDKLFLVTSPNKGEGKSFLASSLAAVPGRLGKRTLLMDCNLRTPSIHTICKISNAVGLGDYFAGDRKVENLVPVPVPGMFDVIPAGSPLINYPQSCFDSDKFRTLFKTLSDEYDAVIMDTPAFECGSDALILSRQTGNALIIVKQGVTSRKSLKALIESMETSGINVLGIVLNKALALP